MQLTEIFNIMSMANGIVHAKSMQLSDMCDFPICN